jgi:V/A-type H+-transporting ATPase subunit A
MIESDDINQKGYISAINGSLIQIKGIEKQIKSYDLIKVAKHNILGEVIQIFSDHVVAQCYESTNNLKLNEEIINLREPLSMELAPGLLSNIFDGIQRPLAEIFQMDPNYGFLKRGIEREALSRIKKWSFVPHKKVNDSVSSGDVIGIVQETPLIKHKLLVPFQVSGKITWIADEGEYTISDEIYRVFQNKKDVGYTMIQKWPVTRSRPYKSKTTPFEPLMTGIRIIDLLFPIAKGGSVAVPGGFGTGKTVIQQSLAKWCNADVIVFIGCGERGNEIADVLKQFSELIDPKSNRPLIERIILIANTSNMPVSAREASIFSGVTIAEYYRDMGYDVAVLADSTSRWAESLREISGLLEEMPAEEGYPAYLPSKLSTFYERAGVVKALGIDEQGEEIKGSLSIIGSVSPPGGDFSEPVTSNTKRFVQAFWALDANLAYSKHYPAINWFDSYSNYPDYINQWWYERDLDWIELDYDWYQCRIEINEILSRENQLKNIMQLIGEENLPEEDQLTLFIGKVIRESLLIQNAFDNIDAFTDVQKLLAQVKTILLLYKECRDLLRQGFLIDDLKSLKVVNEIMRIGLFIPNKEYFKIVNIKNQLLREVEELKLTLGARKKV